MVDLLCVSTNSERQALVFAAFLSNFAGKKRGQDGKGEKRTLVEWQLRETERCQFLVVLFILSNSNFSVANDFTNFIFTTKSVR